MGCLSTFPRRLQKPEKAAQRVEEKLLKAGGSARAKGGTTPQRRPRTEQSQRHALPTLGCDRMLFYNPIAGGVLLRRIRLPVSFSTAAAARSRMGAIVKNSGPVDTSERVKALRQLMEKEDVQA